MMTRWLVGSGLLACLALGPAARPVLADEGRNHIVAVVNSDVITAADVEQALAPLSGQYQAVYGTEDLPAKMEEARTQVVAMLVEERLMLQEARTPRKIEMAKGRWATPPVITISPEELADAIGQAKSRFPTEAEFQRVLGQHGMTMQDLESRFRDQLTIQRLIEREVRGRVVIAPSEITAYYQAHMDAYRGAEAVRLSNILVRVSKKLDDEQARHKAHDLWQRLTAGADFAELARAESDGPGAPSGGAMGWVERGKLIPEIEKAVFALEPGQISPVVKSSLGHHIFRLEERRPPRTKPIAEVQAEIRDALYQHQFKQRYAEWMGRLKERAYITIKG